MIIVFNKYQGTGNDFIIIDNRTEVINPVDSALLKRLCDRRFGIGANGLILISGSHQYDFDMRYYNSDELESTICGNGGRCASAYALSCGTGVTASDIASVLSGQIDINPVRVITKGGNLSVSFKIEGKNITDIWLSGPSAFVFEGMIKI
jgi:diaminopimelate epimerase